MNTHPHIWFFASLCCVSFFNTFALADNLTLYSGDVLQNYRILREESDGVVILHSCGVSKIPYSEMPDSYYNAKQLASSTSANQSNQHKVAEQCSASTEDTNQVNLSASSKNNLSNEKKETYPSPSSTIVSQSANGKSIVTVKFGHGDEFSLEYGGDYVYGTTPRKEGRSLSGLDCGNNIIQGDGFSSTGAPQIIVNSKNSGHKLTLLGDETIDNKIAKTQRGSQFKAVYDSLQPAIATISDVGKIQWLNEGQAKFRITAMDLNDDKQLAEIILPVTVVRLPISLGIPSTELIEKMGFPDKKTKKYFEWYDRSGTCDGIWYYFGTADGYGESVVHYLYDKYSALRIRISTYQSGEPVMAVYTCGWDTL